MEKTYTVDWAERKTTSTGKDKLDATLKDETGATYEKVTIWSDFPNFSEVAPGATVTGTLTPAKDPRFGPTLYPPKPHKAQGGGYKAKAVSDAMERKETSIRAFQGQKEESIKTAGAQRDAVLIVTTFYGKTDQRLDEGFIKEKVVEWRDYFLSKEFNETLPF